ncbi:Vam6p [Rhizophagus irregularis DAOM 197198w]|uniref:Vam6p n=1 Tax=Rhizophagus irregularis (strain DAOM 197198w) TaxID=1432141 RepID=A0A015K477_RHIIW|nr:Vam6p [Rhizophagus irregularis DAOM 197198w]
MHDAFNVFLALDKVPYKIESIFACGQKLFTGTASGALYVYEVNEPIEDEEVKVDLKETKNFFKKPIEQLDIIKDIEVLISLSDGYVNIYDLQTFELQRQLTKTRGANIFAIDTNVEISEDNEGIPMIAVGVRKKLLVFTWRDTEFICTQELSIPDRIKTMVWVNGDKVCLGLTNEYVLIDVNSGVMTELFASHNTPGGASFAYMGMSIGAKANKPLVTKLPQGEILLVKDNMSIFTGLDGITTRKTGIDWTGTPEEIGCSYPYLIAILPKHVEVRNIVTQKLVQTFDLPQARLINQGKYLYVASISNVWRFIPLNFEKQIDQLVEQNEFDEALSLAKIEPTLLKDKDAKIRETRRLYAHYLFHQNKFDDAITIFQELDVDPKEVIALYPPSISGALHKPVQRPKVLKPSDEIVDDEINNDQEEKSSEDEIETENLEILEGKLLEEAVQTLIKFLTDRRHRISKILIQQPHKTNEPTPPASPSHRTNLVNGNLSGTLELAELVDTTLLKSYMVINDALVGPLLRVHNYCNVEEVEGLLLERKKYRELKDLYHGKGLHRKSLELLKKLGQSSEGLMKGTFQTGYYLQKLGPENFDLILEFATWVLQTNPDEGMEIFIGDHPEVDNLPRNKVLEYLEGFSYDLCIKYLEHIIYVLKDPTPDFHNKLIFKYLANVQKLESQKSESNSEEVGEEIEDTNKRLLKFLDESMHYKAEKILGRLRLDDFYEARAILLSRLGQHDQALNIYVHKLKNEKLAEEYCVKNYIETDDPTKNVFISLLKVYLRPSNGEKLMLEPAIRLLSRHGSFVSASDALNMLPLTTKVSELYQFVEKYIRENNKNRNMNMIIKNLLKADQRQVEEQLMFYRSRRVKIDEDKMCPQLYLPFFLTVLLFITIVKKSIHNRMTRQYYSFIRVEYDPYNC